MVNNGGWWWHDSQWTLIGFGILPLSGQDDLVQRFQKKEKKSIIRTLYVDVCSIETCSELYSSCVSDLLDGLIGADVVAIWCNMFSDLHRIVGYIQYSSMLVERWKTLNIRTLLRLDYPCRAEPITLWDRYVMTDASRWTVVLSMGCHGDSRVADLL